MATLISVRKLQSDMDYITLRRLFAMTCLEEGKAHLLPTLGLKEYDLQFLNLRKYRVPTKYKTTYVMGTGRQDLYYNPRTELRKWWSNQGYSSTDMVYAIEMPTLKWNALARQSNVEPGVITKGAHRNRRYVQWAKTIVFPAEYWGVIPHSNRVDKDDD